MKFFANENNSKKGLAVKLSCLIMAILMLLASCGEDTASSSSTKKKKKQVIVKVPASSDVEDTSSENTSSDNTDSDYIVVDVDTETSEEEKTEVKEESKVEEIDEGEDLKKEPFVDHSFTKSTAPANYSKLVWSDEFNGNSLNRDYWQTDTWPDPVKLSDTFISDSDSRLLNVKDGFLNMNVLRWFDPYNANIHYAQAPDIHTTDQMRWRYGYMEVCARMPYTSASWSALWTQTETRDWDTDSDYMVEIDIVEIMGAYDHFTPNLHKWYTKKAQSEGLIDHTQDGERVSYTFYDNPNLANEFHVYGFEWTPTYMTWWIDGKEAYKYEFTKTDGYTDMSNLVNSGDCMWYIIGNGRVSPLTSITMANGNVPNDKDYPSQLQVDWIRLYQDPGVSGNLLKLGDDITDKKWS